LLLLDVFHFYGFATFEKSGVKNLKKAVAKTTLSAFSKVASKKVKK
jgi:hypothetical protein